MATNASIDFLRREKRRQVLSMTMEEDSEERLLFRGGQTPAGTLC